MKWIIVAAFLCSATVSRAQWPELVDRVPELDITLLPTRIQIDWAGGFLEIADSIGGPYVPLVDEAAENFQPKSTRLQLDRHQQFFRVDPCCFPADVPISDDYFLAEDITGFKRTWYSSTLTWMNEPSLTTRVSATPDEAYRLIQFPSFGHYSVARYSRTGDRLSVRKVALGPEGSSYRHCIVSKSVRELSSEEWETVRARVTELNPLSMPTREDILGLDGVNMTLEIVRNGEYHLIDRWSPELDTDKRGLTNYLNFFRDFGYARRGF